MNIHKKPRGNKEKRDKDSILADTKNLLYILHPAIQRMPMIGGSGSTGTPAVNAS